jgi:hypothetical protein
MRKDIVVSSNFQYNASKNDHIITQIMVGIGLRRLKTKKANIKWEQNEECNDRGMQKKLHKSTFQAICRTVILYLSY